MITLQIDGETVTLTKGKWDSKNKALAMLVKEIGEGFPFKGGGYFPDADAAMAYYVIKELINDNLAKTAEFVKNTNKPLESIDDPNIVY